MSLCFLEGCDDGNGIGCGNQNAEDKRADPLPICQIVHPGCGYARREQHAESRQHDDDREASAQLIPGNEVRGFEKKRREQRREDEVFGELDLRRKRQVARTIPAATKPTL